MRRATRAGVAFLSVQFLAGCGLRPAMPSPRPQPEEIPIGYGTRPSEDVTGAVSSVSSQELEAGHFADMVEFLQGRVPGLQVVRLSGGSVSLRIRGPQQSLMGSGEPLLVIDGMPVTPGNMVSALRSIRPKDVENVQVLKDVSSTSIYGALGANGVILIRMKRE